MTLVLSSGSLIKLFNRTGSNADPCDTYWPSLPPAACLAAISHNLLFMVPQLISLIWVCQLELGFDPDFMAIILSLQLHLLRKDSGYVEAHTKH